MLIQRAYRYELFPTGEQTVLMDKSAGCSRFLFNLALEQRGLLYAQWGQSIRRAEQDRQLTQLKKEVPWLREVHSQPLQQALIDLDRAFDRFFKGLSGYPNFRKKHENDSFRYPQPQPEHVREDAIYLPKIGWIEIGRGRDQHRVQGRIQSITVKKQNGHWYASVQCQLEVPDPKPVTEPAVGVDRGVAITCALSDGGAFQTPQFTEGEAKRYLRLQRKLSRQVKGSNQRRKTLEAMRQMRWRLWCRRLDALHKFTLRLAKNHGLIAIEDLRVQHMTRSAKGTKQEPGTRVKQKAGLNRVILQQLWGEIRRQLEYKCGWYGSRLVKVPPAYTSQTCSACGHQHAENRVSQSVFRCGRCHHEMNADLNAALVILALGLRVDACAGAAEGDAARQESVVQDCVGSLKQDATLWRGDGPDRPESLGFIRGNSQAPAAQPQRA